MWVGGWKTLKRWNFSKMSSREATCVYFLCCTLLLRNVVGVSLRILVRCRCASLSVRISDYRILLGYWRNIWERLGATSKTKNGIFWEFFPKGGGSLFKSQNFSKFTKCFFVCQNMEVFGGSLIPKSKNREFWGGPLFPKVKTGSFLGGHLFPKVKLTKKWKFWWSPKMLLRA